jgi:hypothetical protein
VNTVAAIESVAASHQTQTFGAAQICSEANGGEPKPWSGISIS